MIFQLNSIRKDDYSVNMYVAFTEIDDWFIGQIKEMNNEEQTAQIIVLQRVQHKKNKLKV